MVTVQHLVEDELDKNLILVDMLQQELVNVSAVANKIRPTIENKLNKEVKLSAVSMAIRRYARDLTEKKFIEWPFPSHLEVSTKSQIYEVAIEKTPDIFKILQGVSAKIKKGEFLSVIEGTYEILIFTNQSKKKVVREALKGKKITIELDNLAYVTVNWEKITKDIPGIYYRITRELAFKGIPLQSLQTIGSEMMMIFKQDVFLEAYQVIGNLFQQNE